MYLYIDKKKLVLKNAPIPISKEMFRQTKKATYTWKKVLYKVTPLTLKVKYEAKPATGSKW